MSHTVIDPATGHPMNDYDRIVDTLAQWEVDNPNLAHSLLRLFIKIAGEKLRNEEIIKQNIYQALLQNQMIRPEHTKTVYELIQNSKRRFQ